MKDWILFQWQKENAYVERQVWKIEKKKFCNSPTKSRNVQIKARKVEKKKGKKRKEEKPKNKEWVEEKWKKIEMKDRSQENEFVTR